MSEQTTEAVVPGKGKWTLNETIYELSKVTINPKSRNAPAAATLSDRLVLTFRASDDRIYQCFCTKDKEWSDGVVITISDKNLYTSDSPSIAVFNNTLYMAYRSAVKIDGGYPIMLSTLATDTDMWSDETQIKIGGDTLPTDHAPSLTAYTHEGSTTLWLGWQKDSDLFTATSSDGTSWTSMGQIEKVGSNGTPQSDYGPVLCGYLNSMWVIFKARHGKELMWAAYNLTTKEWSGNEDIEVKEPIDDKKPKSNEPPGIAVLGELMYITYKGEDTDDIRVAMLNNQVWSGNKKIRDISDIVPITDSPTSMTVVQDKDQALIMAYKGVGTSEEDGLQIYISEFS
jgi:hypothetical protein